MVERWGPWPGSVHAPAPTPAPGTPLARGWPPDSRPARRTAVASAFWVVSLIGFVAAAIAFWGIGLPGEAWRPLAVVSALVSMAGIVLFFGTWPMFNTLAALAMNVAVLIALLGLRWPPEAMFGR